MTRGRRCSWFSGALQRHIQVALANFWQERFISLRTYDAPTARDLLLSPRFHLQSAHFVGSEAFPPTDAGRLVEALELSELDVALLDRELMHLSNGELRRLLLARGYMENPELWVLDDPFGGLDVRFRAHLAGRIGAMAERGVPMVAFLRRPDERLPGLKAYRWKGGALEPWEEEPACLAEPVKPQDFGPRYAKTELRAVEVGEVLFALEGVKVRFGETTVLGPLDWTVRQGEHWAIMGPNGAGKSTLLGLLTADHPQIYNNRIALLGKRPGEGMSVWEHKARIGFFSPELALHFHESLSLLEVVCGGYRASLAAMVPPTLDERRRALEVLETLELGSRAEESFSELDGDRQRLVLVARALVRPPEVLILDEPTQGLEEAHRDRLFALLDRVAPSTCLLMVTHYPGEWPRCISHVLQL